ncbi:ECF transporter S component [uncultured Microbacterium sp.]|uniref:ECF transporter S component n=2 Tax=Microbacterium TaxID=33882 RepID=UPI000C4FBE73|nr:ECF transporter S component [uncultured Microbacterium sp.]MAM53841.1 hypothetical protein [Microbacterium sp.]|tara:strand:+ start:4464 stop:5576 length:1113 start_codon:yes stop_codon:yes gene_type:complete
MTEEEDASTRASAPFDAIAADLQRLRIESGDVSYADIAARIARRREAEGASPAGARIARSTVYDVFRPGRRRINADLVAEIVLALGGDEQSARDWRRRCLAVRTDRGAVVGAEGPNSDATDTTSLTTAADTGAAPSTGAVPSPTASTGAIPSTSPTPGTGAAPTTAPADADGPTLATLRASLIIAILVGSVGLNLFGTAVAGELRLPVYLDMIGTATAAFALGPWYGLAVGVSTNLLAALITSPETMLFGLVNAAGAVLWGYGIRRFAHTIPRFVVLNLVVALVCTLIAAPLNGLLYDGDGSGHVTDAYITALRTAQGMWLAVFSVNFLASLADKLIAGFAALALARLVAPLRLRDEPIPRLLHPRSRRR